jgi:hypothetical protein
MVTEFHYTFTVAMQTGFFTYLMFHVRCTKLTQLAPRIKIGCEKLQS